MNNFTLGSDPEFMLVHRNQYKSAIDILPKKENLIENQGNRFYFDNVLAEIAINPGHNLNEVLQNTRSALKTLSQLVMPAKFVIKAAGNYPNNELLHEEALKIACVPELDVYTLSMIKPPVEIIAKTPFRTAGGHIHLGSQYLVNDIYEALNVIRMMDLFIGIPALFLDTDESSQERRKLYGQAGSHRVPDHGIEYRALGNFWFSSPEHVSLIYSLSEFILDFVGKGGHKKFWSYDEDLADDDNAGSAHICNGYDVEILKKCINTCDKNAAENFLLFVSNFLPDNIIHAFEQLRDKKLPNPYDAWELN